MKKVLKVLNKALHAAGRIFVTFMPDEEEVKRVVKPFLPTYRG